MDFRETQKDYICSTESCQNQVECRCSCGSLACNAHLIDHIKQKHSLSYLFAHLSPEELSTIRQGFLYLKESCIHKVSQLIAEQNEKTQQLYSKIKDIMTEYSEQLRSFRKIAKNIQEALAYSLHKEKLIIGSEDVFMRTLVELKQENDHLDVHQLKSLFQSYGFSLPVMQTPQIEAQVATDVVTQPSDPIEETQLVQRAKSVNLNRSTINQTIVEKCVCCRKVIQNPKCPFCQANAAHWNCANCEVVPFDKRICSDCINSQWSCEACHQKNLAFDLTCQRCSQVKGNSQVKLHQESCGVCTVELSSIMYCGLCGMKRNSQGCFWCNLMGKPAICGSCRETHWLCNCGKTNRKTSQKCVCGFANKHIKIK